MQYVCNCTEITSEQWKSLMKGARKCSYKKLASKIKREFPNLYWSLCLDVFNPYEGQCVQTKSHYVLVHSAIEYFFRK